MTTTLKTRLRLVASAAACAAALFGTGAAHAAGPVLAQSPTLGRTEIVFTYGGYLWSVPRQGGAARQLTAGGSEGRAFFSPDGRWIAYSSEKDGNRDVYVMPAGGGEARRLTWHPGADVPVGWTPDSKKVLFRSGRDSYATFHRLYTVPVEGGPQAVLPMWRGESGSYSPDGGRVAYVPNLKWQKEWKRYRGGQATPIWLADLKSLRVEKLPRTDSNDSEPVWVGDTVYFLSDRDGPVTLYAYDTRAKSVRRLVDNPDGFDFKSLSAGPDALVYEQFGEVRLFSPETGTSTKVEIDLPKDLPATKAGKVRLAGEITSAGLSPHGDAAVFGAHGDVVIVPAAGGEARNLTRTPGVAERDPAWSPDGRRIAYLSDESGEYALHVRDVAGDAPATKIALGDPPSFFSEPMWSPDGGKILLHDKRLNLWWVDLSSKKMTRIDTALFDVPSQDFAPAWSPDGRFVAYTVMLPSYMHAVRLYSLDQGRSVQVTDGMSDARYPAFDRAGDRLVFAASTDLGPALSWQEMSAFNRPVTRSLYATTLHGPGGAVDLEGLGRRIAALPTQAGNYVGLKTGKAGTLFVQELPIVAPRTGGRAGGLTVSRLDLASGKLEPFADRVRAFALSEDGEKALLRLGRDWLIAPTGAPAAAGQGKLDIAKVEIDVDPRAEWRQMFHEVWRFERDFFYEPGFHGLDLAAAERRYRPFVEAVGGREDLNYLFREMLGELTVGHMFVSTDGRPEMNSFGVGLLGADYAVEAGRYRFARIYDGDVWAPDLKAPLAGQGVKAGDYLLAVNGKPLTADADLYAAFQDTVMRPTRILVGPDPKGRGARELTVTPTFDEIELRQRAWEEDNRHKVDALSGGRLAYVHLPDTSDAGYANFNRFYFAQVGKAGAIVDGRFNLGGSFADYVIDHLGRPLRNCGATREGRDWCLPLAQIFGPKTMLINDQAGSGGEAMPWMFREAGLGPLVGVRTWGGLTAGGAPQLMDGDGVAAPSHGHYGAGGWEIENRGLTPDIDVENDPASMAAGHDRQLERAVEATLQSLAAASTSAGPARPAYPTYMRPWAATQPGKP